MYILFKCSMLIYIIVVSCGSLLSEGAGGEHFGDEVEGSPIDVDPRHVVLDDGVMVEVLEEVHLQVETLKFVRRTKDIFELDLVPSHLHSQDLIKCLVNCLHGSFAKHFPELLMTQ